MAGYISGVANSIIEEAHIHAFDSCSQTRKTIDFGRNNCAEHKYMNMAPQSLSLLRHWGICFSL